ncbi:MAG TPA: hypothetical protein VIT01_07205 [Acidimicrobiales bacterium]
MFRLLTFPFRLAAGSARVGWYAGRAVGVTRALYFGVGFATGVLVASPKARRAALTGVSRVTAAVAERRQDADVTTPPATSVVVTAPAHSPVLPTD